MIENHEMECDVNMYIMRNPRSILQYPKEKRTDAMLTLAISKDPTLLCRLEADSVSIDVRINAIRANPEVITLLSDSSLEEQLAAVRANGMLLGSIAHPSVPVQIEAFKQNPAAIQFVHDLTDDFLYRAIAANGKVLYYIPDPSDKIIDYALSLSGLNIRYLSPLKETREMMQKALASKEREEVIRYFNTVYGGLFWYGRHYKDAIEDAMQLGMAIENINELLQATIRDKEMWYANIQLVNPWGKMKDSYIKCEALRIGINTSSGCLELEGVPVRDFFNSFPDMECDEKACESFRCKMQLEQELDF